MSNLGHNAHAIKHGLEHTTAGKQIVSAAVLGAAFGSKVILGPAAVATVVAAAPIAMPIAIAGGLAYLIGKAKG